MPNAHLMAAWAHGWAISRGTPAPVPQEGGWFIRTGLPHEAARYLLHSAADAVRIIGRPAEARTWIKVSAPPAEVRAPGWTIHPLNHLMYREPQNEMWSLPSGYTARFEEIGDVVRAVVLAPDGSRAAWAQTGLTSEAAIFDQVETDPAHRRRGLGRAVMSMLSEQAGDRTGVLVATDEGRALYASLGWHYASPITALEHP